MGYLRKTDRGLLAALSTSGVLVLAIVAGGLLAGGLVLFSDFPVSFGEPKDEAVQVEPGSAAFGGSGAVAARLGRAARDANPAGRSGDRRPVARTAGSSAGGGSARPVSGAGINGNGESPGNPGRSTGGGNGGSGGAGQGAEAGGSGEGEGSGEATFAFTGPLDDTLRNLYSTVVALRAGKGGDTLGGVSDTVGNGLVRDVGDILGGREQPGGPDANVSSRRTSASAPASSG